MRLGSKKRIAIRMNHAKKRKCSLFLLFIFIFALMLAMLMYFLNSVRPAMIRLAKAEAEFLAIDLIQHSVSEVFAENPFSYTELVQIEKDAEGNICALKSDLASINRIKADIALLIQDKIQQIELAEIAIPLGSLSDIDMLAGLGPFIHVKLMPYGNARLEFLSSFEAAGVNQTRLCVNLKVQTDLGLLMPTVDTVHSVEDTIPVFQTILLGEVPESYFQVESSDETIVDHALDLAP